jgi:hypothetical protein
MAEGLSTTLVSNWLNTLRSAGAAFGPVAGTFVQLHTANPGAAGTTAVSAGSATRIAATFAASSSGSALALSGSVGPWTNGGTSETLTDISVWTASQRRHVLVLGGAHGVEGLGVGRHIHPEHARGQSSGRRRPDPRRAVYRIGGSRDDLHRRLQPSRLHQPRRQLG